MWEKLHARIALFLILVTCSLLIYRYPARLESFRIAPPTDFSVYIRAWHRVEQRVTPYVVSDSSPYKYAPGVLALVSVLPRAPERAWVVFSLFSILCLGGALLIGGRYNSKKSLGLLILGLILSWKGILETLDYGQLEFIILAFAVLAGALRLRQPVIAGFLAGTLPWLKLPWVLLLLPLILVPLESLGAQGKRPRRVRLLISGYFFSWFVWGVAIPTFVFGTDRTMVLTREWLEILRSQPAALYWSDMNQSAWMSVLRWIGGNPLIGLGVVSLLGGYLMGCLTTRNLKSTPGRDVFSWLSPWLILTQLLNPLAWRWGSVFLVGIPFAVAGLSVSREKNIARTLLMGGVGVLWLLQLNPVVQRLGYHHWSEMHQYGLLTAYWFILLVLCLDRQFYWPSGKSSGPDAGSEGGGAAFSASA